jgi:hypothetical protein
MIALTCSVSMTYQLAPKLPLPIRDEVAYGMGKKHQRQVE